jgi:hypothetical protein
MTFLHGYLLGGLLLAGLPVLLHLIMRQKPKRLPFPAFRFLKRRHLINRRRLRLQQLLLLALRVAVLAALCLALARPRLAAEAVPRTVRDWLGLGNDRAVAAVFVFDTGFHVECRDDGPRSRLDEARRRAHDLLADVADGSQVAVLDTGDAADEEWMSSLSQVRDRLDRLRVRPTQSPLVSQVARGYRLLEKAADGPNAGARVLYVFSDRTVAGWDDRAARANLRPPEGVRTVFVDVGADGARDVTIDEVTVDPPVVAPGAWVEVRTQVRARGRAFTGDLTCQLDEELTPRRQRLRLEADGKPAAVTFRCRAPRREDEGGSAKAVYQVPCQVTVRLDAGDGPVKPPYRINGHALHFLDALPFNNVRFATFLVREDGRRQGRRLLTLAEDPAAARGWKTAFESVTDPARGFRCEVRRVASAGRLTAKDLAPYAVVCLFQATQPPAPLWDALRDYVREGGGLVVVPAGEELDKDDLLKGFNEDGVSRGLLPARLRGLRTVPADQDGPRWSSFAANSHALMAPFREWALTGDYDFTHKELWPFVNRYWQADLVEGEECAAAATYDDGRQTPIALAERRLGEGRVVLFTTVLDGRQFNFRGWNNYCWNESSFGFVLVNCVASYLAGGAEAAALNFRCGEPVVVGLPAPAAAGASYTFEGEHPDLSESERLVPAVEGRRLVNVVQASAPGNFTLTDGKGNRVAGFSLNVRPEESNLERVPVADVEAVLGEGTVLPTDQPASLRDAVREAGAAPLELLPVLMMLVLAALTVEALLANHYHRRQAPAAPDAAPLAGGAP